MKTKRLFISTLIAAAAMGLTAYANEAATQTTPVIAETDAPEGADKLLPLADAPAAEDADASAEETQDADALELLLADDALVELDEASAPDELSTETMMREWIARYAAAARFAGIRSVKGTGGGLSSGGPVATAGADFAISAAAPTPSVSAPAAGTVSLADMLTRASAAGVSLGSAIVSDAGTASVATASSASGTSTILPAAFFSTRSVFSAVPAATASYSLAGSSGDAAVMTASETMTGTNYTVTGPVKQDSATTIAPNTVNNVTGSITDASNTSVSSAIVNRGDTFTFNGVTGYLPGWDNATFEGNIILAADSESASAFIWDNGSSYYNKTITFSGSLSGSGTFEKNTGNKKQSFIFTGDVTGFSGNFLLATRDANVSTSALTFGDGDAAFTGTYGNGNAKSVSGTGQINWAGQSVVFNYNNTNAATVGNSSITTKTLTFSGGANYTVSSTVTGSDSTVSNNTLTISAGTTTFTGAVSNFGNVTVASGAGELTFSASSSLDVATLTQSVGTLTLGGKATITTLTQSAGAGMLNINGEATKNITNLTLAGTGMTVSGNLAVSEKISVCNAATVRQTAGTVSATRLALNDSSAKKASFYTLEGGVLNITGTGKENSTGGNAILIGHWPADSGQSKLTVSDGTLNAISGYTLISWDSAGQLEISGGTANLYAISLNRERGNAANVTLSSGRLNLGAGGLFYGGTAMTKTVTLSGGTLGALDAWTSSMNMSVNGAVTIDTTKQVVLEDGTSENADGNIGSSIELSGRLSGSGALKKAGAGTLTLSGANSYTNGTTIEAGTLVAGNERALGTGNVVVADGATLARGLSSGSVAIDGTLTTNGAAILSTGTLNAVTAAFAVTGDVTLDAGTIFNLSALEAGKLISAETVTFGDGFATPSLANFLLNGCVFGNRTNLTVSNTDGVLAIDSVTQNALALTWAGGAEGTWKANGSGWRTVADSPAAETFQTGDTVTFTDVSAGAVTVDGNISVAAMTIDSTSNYTFTAGQNGAAIAGAGALTKRGTGTATIDASVDLSGIAGGITVEADGGRLVVDTASGYAGTVTAGENGTFTLNVSSDTTLANTLSGAGTFEKTGAGTLTLNSNISASTLTLSVAEGAAKISGGTNTLAAVTVSGEGSTLTISGGTTNSAMSVGNGALLVVTAGNDQLSAIRGSLTIQSGGEARFDNKDVCGWSSGSRLEVLTIESGGVLTYNYDGNETFCGTLTLNGTLRGGAAAGSATFWDFFNGNAKFETTAWGAKVESNIGIRLGQATSVFQVNSDASLEVLSVISQRSGAPSTGAILKKTGSGMLILSGANTYAGGTTIENGTLVAANARALGSGSVTAAGSSTVNEVTLRVGETGATSALTIANNISVSLGKTLRLESANADNKLTGTISGAGALKLASGTLEIAGTSSLKLVKVGDGAVLKFSGETTSIMDDTDGALVDGGGKLVFSSGTATVSRIILNSWSSGATSTASALAEVSGGIVNVESNSDDGAISIGSGYSTHSHTLTISGGVLNATAGTTTLGYFSAGTLAVTGGEANLKGVVFGLSGVNSAGTLQVTGGRLNVGESGITSGGGSGTKTISFSDATVGALDSWSSAASLGISLAGDVTFDTTKRVASDADTAGTTIMLAGALSGSGTLTKVGAGTLKLTGDNSAYMGNVTLSAGTLEIGHNNALGKGTVTVDADGKLGIAAGVTITEVSGGIVLASGAQIVVDLSNRLSETATFEVTLATNTAISLAAEAARAYSEGDAKDLTDYLKLKGWDNKSGWTSSLTYANETLTLTMAIPEPSLFGLLAGVTALGFSMSSRRRRKKA